MSKSEKTEKNKLIFLSILEKTLGVISTACEKSNLSRTQVYKWMDDDLEFKDKVSEIKDEICVDFAESSLLKQIKNGNTSATIFFLKTRGKHRGYIERVEQKIEVQEELPLFPDVDVYKDNGNK